jgi:hypothetical protein
MEVTTQVLTVVKILMLVFWVVTPCGLGGRCQNLGGRYYFNLPTSPHGVTSQKTNIDINVCVFRAMHRPLWPLAAIRLEKW